MTLDSVNSNTAVSLALNVSPHFLPQWDRSLHTLFSLCYMYSMSLPPIIPFLSSAISSPSTLFELKILAALSKAMIQNFALHTPPWGKPIFTVTSSMKFSYAVSRFL